MAMVSHALNHSAMEAELTTSRLHSFNMAKVCDADNHSAMTMAREKPHLLSQFADLLGSFTQNPLGRVLEARHPLAARVVGDVHLQTKNVRAE